MALRVRSGLVAFSLLLLLGFTHAALPKLLAEQLQSIWEDDRELNTSDIELLRREAWDMFDEGFNNYMTLAFPKDNLLPISCTGADWQGGMALTLLDSLDALLVMGRLGDMRSGLPLIKQHVDFARDIKVHVFEVVIRVLGGLLSGHSLLARMHDTMPGYDGSLLQLATQLAERLKPAFNSPSGLPFQFTNLQKGPVTDVRTTCTACAGTLLLEYGTLSALTGDPSWRVAAEHAAHVLYTRRSSLGLVGASVDVGTSTWVSREATIGPGTDSFYEYMLKSYIMFGNRTHLDMFADLYLAAMRYLQLPSTLRGYAFLTDVHMDSGRMSKPYVSSLGAFWPAMQALIGQVQDAAELHANFTAAWQTWGLLPELFGLDLSRVHPEDPGYNLRPEHIESTYVLHALTGKPAYRQTAARMLRTLQVANRAPCGFASVENVETGVQSDLQESFFLSETVKYLYLTFSPGAEHLLDYYVLSTEGHILPTFPPTDPSLESEEQLELQTVLNASSGVPHNCAALCQHIDDSQQSEIERTLRRAFPLLTFRRKDALTIRRRRCIACVHVTQQQQRLAAAHLDQGSIRPHIMQLNAELQSQGLQGGRGHRPLSQVVCILAVSRAGIMACSVLRPLSQHDILHGLPHNAVVLQLVWASPQPIQPGLLLVTPVTPDDKASLLLPAATATFGNVLIDITPACMRQLLGATAALRSAASQQQSQSVHEAEKEASVRHARRSSKQRAPTHAEGWHHAHSHEHATCPAPRLHEMPHLKKLLRQVLLAQRGLAIMQCPAPRPQPLQPWNPGSPVQVGTDPPATHSGKGPPQSGSRDSTVFESASNTDDGSHGLPHAPNSIADVAANDPVQAQSGHASNQAEHLQLLEPGGDYRQYEGVQAPAAAAGTGAAPAEDGLLGSSWRNTAADGRDASVPAELAEAQLPAVCLGPCEPSCSHLCHGDACSASSKQADSAAPVGVHAGTDRGEEGQVGQAGVSLVVTVATQAADGAQGTATRRDAQAAATASKVDTELQVPQVDGSSTPGVHRDMEVQGTAAGSQVQQHFVPHQTGVCRNVPITYAELLLADPPFACQLHFGNAAAMAGRIVVVPRGGCSFAAKVLAAQTTGAQGVIVVDLERDEEVQSMSEDQAMGSSASTLVHIPSLLLGATHSRLLLNAMMAAIQKGHPAPVATMALDHPALRSGVNRRFFQQQQRQQQWPQAEVKGQAGQEKAGSIRVELMVPSTSHEFIRTHLLTRLRDPQAAMDSLMNDERVVLLLMQLAKENEVMRAGGD